MSSFDLQPLADATDKENLNKKELLRRAAVLRGKATRNQTGEVKNRRPDMHYFWELNTTQAVAEREAQEYEVVKAKFDKNKQPTADSEVTPWLKQDGTHIWGDLILMRVKQELYEAYMAIDELKSLETIENSRGGMTPEMTQFARANRGLGIRVDETHMEQ